MLEYAQQEKREKIIFIVRGIYLLIFVIPFIFIPGLYDAFLTPKEAFFQIITIGLCLGLFIKGICQKDALFFYTPINPPVIIFLAISLFLIPFSLNPYEAVQESLNLLAGILLFFLVINSYSHLPNFSKLADIMIFTGTIISLIGFTQYWGEGYSFLHESAPPASTFGHRNFAAGYLVFIIPLIFYRFLLSIDLKKEILYTISFFSVGSYMIFSQCRGAWIGVLGGLIFFLISFAINRRRKWVTWNLAHRCLSIRKQICLIIAFLVIIILTQIPANKRIEDKELFTFKGGTGQTRLIFWKNTSAMVLDHLFLGVGIGNFKIHYPRYWQAVTPDIEAGEGVLLTHPHNDFVEILAENGLIGFFSFLFFITSVFYTAFIAIKKMKSHEDQLGLLFICTAIISSLIQGFFSFPLKRPSTTMLFWLYSGLIGVFYLKTNEGEKKSIRCSRLSLTGLYLLTPLVLSMFVFILYREQTKIVASYHFMNSISSAGKGMFNVAKAEISSSIKLQPDDYDARIISAGLDVTMKNFKEAETNVLQALRLRPYTPLALNMLGYIYMKTERVKESINIFQQAVDLKPDYISPIYRTGVAYLKLGMFENSTTEFKKVLKYDPTNSNANEILTKISKVLSENDKESLKKINIDLHFEKFLP